MPSIARITRLTGLALSLAAGPALAQCPYVYGTEWGGIGTGDTEFQLPFDIAIAPDGGVLVADYRNDRIKKFDRDGNLILQFGGSGTAPGQLRRPIAITVDAGGNIYVLEHLVFRVQKFSPSGSFLTSWAVPGSGTYQDMFDLVADAAGNVYVPDPSEEVVYKYGPTGTLLDQWTSGDPDWFPLGITIDEFGTLYLFDSGEFVKLDTGLNDVQPRTTYGGSSALQVRGGLLFCSEVGTPRVRVDAEGGGELCSMGGPGSGAGQLDLPIVAVPAPGGSVYVSDFHISKIFRYDPAAVPAAQATWGEVKALYR
jgi:DNA-binding beta-propeller fold protein YncE